MNVGLLIGLFNISGFPTFQAGVDSSILVPRLNTALVCLITSPVSGTNVVSKNYVNLYLPALAQALHGNRSQEHFLTAC